MARLFSRRRRWRTRPRNGDRRINPWLAVPLILLGLMLAGGGAAAIAGFVVYQSYAKDLVPIEEALARQSEGGAQILDRNGRPLYQFVDDLAGLREPVALSDVSPYLIDATISTEDASFYSNPGINIKGLLRAAYENFFPGQLGFLQGSGGSSITQQLVKNVYISVDERVKRSISRKLRETVYAIELTHRYSKDQILEWYLNQIPYGGIYYGVEAAAQGYFGKSAKELTLAESALLAGIPACPSCYDPREDMEAAIKRRHQVLVLMMENNKITPEEAWVANLEPVELAPNWFPVEAPHWVLSYIGPELEKMFGHQELYRGGLRVTTTLDLDLQRKAEAILEEKISDYEETCDGHNGALVALDPTTGEILAYVGSRNYFREDILGQNDMAQALNSPGSALKPFNYVTSFMKLGWGPGTLVLDTPTSFTEADGDVFTPRNPSGDFKGPISIRTALGNSLNVPAFKVILATGVEAVVSTARKMGLTELTGSYGPSFTIGGVDVKLVDMVFAYSVFANSGVMRGVPTVLDLPEGDRTLDPVSILLVEDSEGNVLYNVNDYRQDVPVIPAEYSYLITSILTDPQAQCYTFGCGGLSIPGQRAAIKTGTSEPYEDSHAIGDTWAMGYTPNLAAGVWAGNADNSPMWNIVSTSISWRALRDFMEVALEGEPALTFEQPPGVVKATVCFPSGMLPTEYCGKTVDDLFVTDSLPEEEDDWWQPIKIDTRNGLLATEMTPPQFVEERVFLVLPESLTGFSREQAEEWAEALGVALAPTERSDPNNLPVVITTPAWGSTLNGVVTVSGRAVSSDFESYRLEYGAGTSPAAWTTILESTTPVSDAVLGSWDTRDLKAGTYTLRLVVIDRERGELSTITTVKVGQRGSPTPPPTPRPLPTATPTPRPPRGNTR